MYLLVLPPLPKRAVDIASSMLSAIEEAETDVAVVEALNAELAEFEDRFCTIGGLVEFEVLNSLPWLDGNKI